MDIQPQQPPHRRLTRLNPPDGDYSSLKQVFDDAFEYVDSTYFLVTEQDSKNQEFEEELKTRINNSIAHLLYIRNLLNEE